MKGGEIIEQLGDHQLLNQDSPPWSFHFSPFSNTQFVKSIAHIEQKQQGNVAVLWFVGSSPILGQF
jgi:hypothetical protein